MDWNWFFSALAQSCAAIVGLMGAFIFTRIISSESSYKTRLTRLEELLIRSKYLSRQLDLIDFLRVNELELKSFQDHLSRLLLKENEYRSVDQYWLELDVPMFKDRPQVLEFAKEVIESDQLHKQKGKKRVVEVHSIELGYSKHWLDKEKETIAEKMAEAQANVETVRSFVIDTTSAPEYSISTTVTVIACGLVFLIGVVYPLGLLPADRFDPERLTISSIPGAIFSFRGILLAIVSMIFMGLMVWLIKVNARLRVPDKELEMIKPYSNLGGYSDYFAIHEANMLIKFQGHIGKELRIVHPGNRSLKKDLE